LVSGCLFGATLEFDSGHLKPAALPPIIMQQDLDFK